MTDEIEDSFTRLKEYCDTIKLNVAHGKKSLAIAMLNKLQADLDVLESEIALTYE